MSIRSTHSRTGSVAMPAGFAALCACSFSYTPNEVERFERLGIQLPNHVKHSVAKRRIEFLAGRYCAAIALSRVGCATVGALSARPDRSPAWPDGWVGSISHCEGHAIAVAGAVQSFRGFGIDIENILTSETAQNIAQLVSRPEEIRLLERFGLTFGEAVTLAFSAKESLYKLLWPQDGDHIGFHNAWIASITPSKAAFGIELDAGVHSSYPDGGKVIGNFWLTSRRVMTLLWRTEPECQTAIQHRNK